MKSFQDELAEILSAKDETAAAAAFQKFCRDNADRLPLPGQDLRFDQAMWAASEFVALSAADQTILQRVTDKLIGSAAESNLEAGVINAALRLKDLIGQGKEQAINVWQEMLTAMSWQQMVPAGALRGIGTQMVSLGSFQKQLADASIHMNIGWMVDKDDLRILLQAKDGEEPIADVELRIKEAERGVVYSRKTNEDGAVVATNVHVGAGCYQVEVIYGQQVACTPYFLL